MNQKSVLNCHDGRSYHLTMSWDEKIKESLNVFPIKFEAIDRESGRALKMPKEIATFAVGTPLETLAERIKNEYGGSKDQMIAHYLEMAYRRVTDWINRGR